MRGVLRSLLPFSVGLLLGGAGLYVLRPAPEPAAGVVCAPLAAPAAGRQHTARAARSPEFARHLAEPEAPALEPAVEPGLERPEAVAATSEELAIQPAEDRNLGAVRLPSGAIAPDFRVPDPPPPLPFDPDDE